QIDEPAQVSGRPALPAGGEVLDCFENRLQKSSRIWAARSRASSRAHEKYCVVSRAAGTDRQPNAARDGDATAHAPRKATVDRKEIRLRGTRAVSRIGRANARSSRAASGGP